MDVSIIIPVYKRLEWLGKCVEGLMAQTFGGSFEIIIVDDGSPNEPDIRAAVAGLQTAGRPAVRYLGKPHRGPAAARNSGVNSSAGTILCFIDDDSITDRNWLNEITRPFREGAAALVSGRTYSFDRLSSFPLLLEKTVYAGKSWATCNIAYRRDAFEALGGFDEYFTEPSWEDNDLGIRAGWAGYVHAYNELAVVYHPHERSVEEYRKKCLLNGRGAAAFSRKYLLRKPVWGIGTPLAMARRLGYAFYPSSWRKDISSRRYLKFLWSYYSLVGFIGTLKGTGKWKKPEE